MIPVFYDFTIMVSDFFFSASDEFTGFIAPPLVFKLSYGSNPNCGRAGFCELPGQWWVASLLRPTFLSGALPDDVGLQNTDGFVGSLSIGRRILHRWHLYSGHRGDRQCRTNTADEGCTSSYQR